MKKSTKIVKMIKLLALLLVSNTALASIKIASGSKLGLYHTLAVKECEKRQPCEVVATSGSRENIDLLKSGQVDFAIIQNNLGLDGLKVVKEFPEKEHLHIFHKKEVESLSQLMNEGEYSIDKGSGTYAVLFALHKVLGFNLQAKHRSILEKEKKESFCQRKTNITFYNIAETSFHYQQIKLLNLPCRAKEYKLTTAEQEIIRKTAPQLTIKDGLIENGIVMVEF